MPALQANRHTDFTSWPWPVQLYPTVKIKANCISVIFVLFWFFFFLVGRHRHILFVMVSSLLYFISKPENFQRQIYVVFRFDPIGRNEEREKKVNGF